jgi:hypothetical protein
MEKRACEFGWESVVKAKRADFDSNSFARMMLCVQSRPEVLSNVSGHIMQPHPKQLFVHSLLHHNQVYSISVSILKIYVLSGTRRSLRSRQLAIDRTQNQSAWIPGWKAT